jgi:hypothetical protein
MKKREREGGPSKVVEGPGKKRERKEERGGPAVKAKQNGNKPADSGKKPKAPKGNDGKQHIGNKPANAGKKPKGNDGPSKKRQREAKAKAVLEEALGEVDEAVHNTSVEIGAFHTLFKVLARCTDQRERDALNAQLEAMGGLAKYQKVKANDVHSTHLTNVHLLLGRSPCPVRRPRTSTPRPGCCRSCSSAG